MASLYKSKDVFLDEDAILKGYLHMESVGYCSPTNLALFFGLNRYTVVRHMDAGIIPSFRVGTRNVISKDTLEKLLLNGFPEANRTTIKDGKLVILHEETTKPGDWLKVANKLQFCLADWYYPLEFVLFLREERLKNDKQTA